jgi:formylglycine-generating enzyme required for sulfatase activity
MIRALSLCLLASSVVAGCRKGQEHGAAPSSSALPLPAPLAATKPVAASCNPGCSNIERCENARCVPACPETEVFIPATGPAGFAMGRGKAGDSDRAHQVVLTHPFCIDSVEVTVAAYRACVTGGACTVPQLNDANSNYRPEFDRPKHPINMVNWGQAKTYCESRGQALPTEAQWEWAASRGQGRKYPWGNEPEPTCDNRYADFTPGGSPKTDPAGNVGCHGGGTSEVGSHPNGKVSWPDGDVFDLAGNLWEWTADCYLPYPAEQQVDPSPQAHPKLGGDCYVRALRGGGWNRSITALQTFQRAASKRTYRVPALGFRCVRNPMKTQANTTALHPTTTRSK